MGPRRFGTRGLRRRLTIAFVLVAAVSAGALALGSFLLVREVRLRDSLEQAGRLARAVLRVATSPTDLVAFENLRSSITSTGIHGILIQDDIPKPLEESFDPDIPRDLRERVRRGELGFARVTDDGHHELLIGGKIPGTRDELYVIFVEDAIHRELAQLGIVLATGWGLVVAVSGLIGRTLARRTLEPVARASEAARSMAAGRLATRLPVEGQDEFGAWAASFNEMADALETKINALSEAQARERRFTSDVAHELRTPVTALVGEASLLKEHLERMPPESRRPAELVIHDVARLRRLVEDLMEISRFDAGGESVRLEPVDLRALVDAVLRVRGWEGGVEVSGGPVLVQSDRRRAERIVANLIGNAIEHGGRDVRVSVGKDGDRAFVEVADGGTGILPDRLPHLFERFYKADSSRTSPGSGLGLAIALENARLMGGTIEVASEPGVGSTFTARLPVASGVVEPLQGGEARVTPSDDPEASSSERE